MSAGVNVCFIVTYATRHSGGELTLCPSRAPSSLSVPQEDTFIVSVLVEGRALPKLVGRWAGAGALRVPSLRVHFSVAPVHTHRHTAEARVFFLNGAHFLHLEHRVRFPPAAGSGPEEHCACPQRSL